MDTTKEPVEVLPFHLIWLLGPLQNAIKSWRRNFSKLTLVLILPALCFIFLSQLHTSNSFLSVTTNVVIVTLSRVVNGSAASLVEGDQETILHHQYQTDSDTDKSVFFDVFKSLFLFPFLVLSPLPIATVVYYVATTIANNNQLEPARNYTYHTILNTTFTVWKRLIVISHQGYVAVLSAATLATVVLTCLAQVLATHGLVSFLGLLYQSGLVYLCMLWQSTMILKVLHEAYTKINIHDYSKKVTEHSEIIEGKIMLAEAIVLLPLIVLRAIIKMAYYGWMASGDSTWWVFGRILVGIDGALSISLFSLFALVVQASIWEFTKVYRLERFQAWCSLLGQDQGDHRQEEACQEDHHQVVEVQVEESMA